MATIDTNTFQSSANLSLWFKVYTGDILTLADMPEIIPLRWNYFRDNWPFLKQLLLNSSSKTYDPDYFRFTLDDLTDFINKQQASTTNVNPFAASSIYYRFFPVFDTIKLETITLTNEERTIIANRKIIVGSYSKMDFLKIKKALREYRDQLADLVGLSDPDYNAIYNRGSIAARTSPSIADMNLMLIIQQELSTVDFILANLFAVDTAVDPFALAKLNANNPEIDIGQYKSGRLVKLNSGEDLPSLAKRFFNNADKWIDIAVANGLKEPYVDEIGEQLFLLANGNGNQINVASTDTQGNINISKFFINQLILIQSTTLPFSTQRLITGIRQIPVSGEIILTISGDLNMSSYLLSESASVRIFKPNTINSSQYILIPSEVPLAGNRTEEIPWFLAGKTADEKNTKIDLLVGENGQLLKTSIGDIALSYGLDNAIQAIKTKMLTELGSNSRHPLFGLINLSGTPTSQVADAKNALVESINSQIQADSRFDRVQSLDVSRNPSRDAVAYDVTLVVKLAGSNTFIPITFTVAT